MSGDINGAKTLLESAGYVVLRAKSYRQAQERQRVAEALLRAAERDMESHRDWAHGLFDEERRLRDRCEFLYGMARSLGATDEQMHVRVVPWVSAVTP